MTAPVSGLSLKAEGLALIEGHAGDFLAVMRALAKRIAEEQGHVSSDDLRSLADELGIIAPHPNAWGGLFRGHHWRCVEMRPSTYHTNHARYIRVWTYHEGI